MPEKIKNKFKKQPLKPCLFYISVNYCGTSKGGGWIQSIIYELKKQF